MHIERARALTELKRYRLAIDEARAHLAEYPQDFAGFVLLASLLARCGERNEAATTIQIAIELAPDQPPVYYTAAFVCLLRGEYRTAEQAIRECLRLDSENCEAHYLRAWILWQQERWKEAVKACDVALSLEPTDSRYWVLKGRALVSLGRIREADEAFYEALKHDPENSDAHDERAQLLLKKQDADQALYHFREARRLSPVDKENTGWIAATLGQRLLLVRLLNRVHRNWYRWPWVAIWGVYAALAVLVIAVHQDHADIWPAWTEPALAIATANWTLLPVTTRCAANAFGRILARRGATPLVTSVGCTFTVGGMLAVHAIGTWILLSGSVAVLILCLLIACFACVRHLLFEPQITFHMYVAAFSVPLLLGAITAIAFSFGARQTESYLIAFLGISLLANTAASYLPFVLKPSLY